MSVVNVPLDPREIEEIEELLSEIADGTVKDRYRARLLAQAQGEANRAAADRKLYREALDLAKREGYADPEAFARIQVEKQHLGDQYEQRIRAIFKRVEADNRKHMNVSSRAVEGKLFASTVGIRALAAGGWNKLREQLPQSPRRGS